MTKQDDTETRLVKSQAVDAELHAAIETLRKGIAVLSRRIDELDLARRPVTTRPC